MGADPKISLPVCKKLVAWYFAPLGDKVSVRARSLGAQTQRVPLRQRVVGDESESSVWLPGGAGEREAPNKRNNRDETLGQSHGGRLHPRAAPEVPGRLVWPVPLDAAQAWAPLVHLLACIGHGKTTFL